MGIVANFWRYWFFACYLKMYLIPVKQKLCAVVWLSCCISILLAMGTFYVRNKMKCNIFLKENPPLFCTAQILYLMALMEWYITLFRFHSFSKVEDDQWNNTWNNWNRQNESYELLLQGSLLWIVHWGIELDNNSSNFFFWLPQGT